jgi:hypothetical protein
MTFFIPSNIFWRVIKLHAFGRKYYILLEMLTLASNEFLDKVTSYPAKYGSNIVSYKNILPHAPIRL